MSIQQFIDSNMNIIKKTVHWTDFNCFRKGFEITEDQHLDLYFLYKSEKITTDKDIELYFYNKSTYIRDVFDIWLAKKERTIDDFINAFYESGYLTFSQQLKAIYTKNQQNTNKNIIDFFD